MAILRLNDIKVTGKDIDGEVIPEKYTYDLAGFWLLPEDKKVAMNVSIKCEQPLPITKTDVLLLNIEGEE